MSMPTLPPISPGLNREDAINLILASIAMEELGLSHIINAEGEKLQYVLGTIPGISGPAATIEEVLQVNGSVNQLLSTITQKEMLLKAKMDSALGAAVLAGPTGPTGPTGSSGLFNLVDGESDGSVQGIHTGGGCDGTAGSAIGVDAVALNTSTVASGDASLAIGNGTIASGAAAFSQGECTVASGMNAVAEGLQTVASGVNSHAEGSESIAGGEGSHAEGILTEASEFASHAEGSETLASGLVSHAEGSETRAEGDASHAEGSLSTATGTVSHAEGFGTTAVGDNSHAEGSETRAEGDGSHAEGCLTISSGTCSHAEGAETIAEDQAAHAEGFATTASGTVSHSEGYRTIASEFAAHAEGSETLASGQDSHAGGLGTISQGLAQTAIGRFNIASGNPFTSTSTDNAFIIGNGGFMVNSNAFRVQFNGDVHSASGNYTTGADYAEMFEWQDSNPQNEDRRGYFVTLDGKYIRKATAQDQYILGVVSSTPSIVGDSQSMAWQGMYLEDEWGAVIYEWVEALSELSANDTDIHNQQIRPQTTRIKQPKLNPAYNPNLIYTPRTERSEWDAIGMLGKLRVRDDGTCVPNGFCGPDAEGIATARSQGYRVLERIDHNKVLILLDGLKTR